MAPLLLDEQCELGGHQPAPWRGAIRRPHAVGGRINQLRRVARPSRQSDHRCVPRHAASA